MIFSKKYVSVNFTARFVPERMVTHAARPTKREDFAFATSSVILLSLVSEGHWKLK